jgi:periplasmic protein TonB
MLGQLLESSPRRVRRPYSTLVSVVGHAILLTSAVAVAKPVTEPAESETILTWHPAAPPPPPRCMACSSSSQPGSVERGAVPRLPFTDRTLGEITLDLPDSTDVIGPGVAISSAEWQGGITGDRPGPIESSPGQPTVDREVVPFATNPAPRYPVELREARIEGKVVARFVVDTTGRVIMATVNVDAADHPAFGVAVVEALRRSWFQPAEFRGRKVPQLVSQPFVFVLREAR